MRCGNSSENISVSDLPLFVVNLSSNLHEAEELVSYLVTTTSKSLLQIRGLRFHLTSSRLPSVRDISLIFDKNTLWCSKKSRTSNSIKISKNTHVLFSCRDYFLSVVYIRSVWALHRRYSSGKTLRAAVPPTAAWRLHKSPQNISTFIWNLIYLITHLFEASSLVGDSRKCAATSVTCKYFINLCLCVNLSIQIWSFNTVTRVIPLWTTGWSSESVLNAI